MLTCCRRSADPHLFSVDMLVEKRPDYVFNNDRQNEKSVAITKDIEVSEREKTDIMGMGSFPKEERMKEKRRAYLVVMLLVLFFLTKGFLRYREYVNKKESMQLKAQADFESRSSDLLVRGDKSREESADLSENHGQAVNEDITRIIRQKYSEVNSLCDEYYQNSFCKRDNEKAAEKINSIVSGLTDKEGIDNIISYVFLL